MRRAWRTGTVALAAAAVLAGCSPPHLNLIAVYVGDDGKPWVMMAACGSDRIASAHVMSEAEPGAAPPAGLESGWVGWWTEAGARGGTFPLFEPPASWHSKPMGEQRLLAGRTYWAQFRSPDDGVYYGEAYFTEDDLAGLAPGEVWADGRAMSRGAFRKVRDDAC